MAAIAGVVLIGLSILAHESEKPEFCRSCHIMEPYYKSWETSTHNGVNCLVCHFDPGLRGFIRGKTVAFSQFVRYITVTYGSKPWAEVSDANCLRAGCHEGTDLEGPREYRKGVLFDHSHHLSGLRRGKQLRCTSCHSQIVQGTHMTVTESVCYICHFKPLPDGSRDKKMSDCRTCHIKGVTSALAPEEHALFIERGTDCLKCHFSVIQGKGLVSKKRCESCHSDPEHLKVETPEELHEEHVSRHKVECFECHEAIKHHLETPDEIAGADCRICHAERHHIQRAFYEGSAGAPFGKRVPSAMIEAHIACSGCHSSMANGDEPTSKTLREAVAYASKRACDYCHGSGYDRLLEEWHQETARRLDQMRVLTHVADTTLKGGGTSITALAGEIYRALDVIEQAHAVHNIGYSATLINHSQQELLDATSHTAVGATMHNLLRNEMASFRETPSCLQRCHYGINNRTTFLKNQNREYPHAPHVNRARLDCGACHSREVHKVSLPRGYDCIGCHHKRTARKQCIDCHKDVFDFAQGGFGGYDVASPQNVECLSCHGDNANKIVMLNRQACRECHVDDKTYLDQLEREREELGRLSAEVDEGLKTKWAALDFQGLRIVEQVRHVERINGIHNYALAKEIYTKARAYLATGVSRDTANVPANPRISQLEAQKDEQ